MNYTLTVSGSRLLRHWVWDDLYSNIFYGNFVHFKVSICKCYYVIQVTHPLCDRNMISARLDAVSEIAESVGSYRASQNVGSIDEENSDVAIVQPDFYSLLSTVLTNLGRSPDIQRGITRIFHRTATASEVNFGLFLRLLTYMPILCQCFAPHLSVC